MLVLNDYAEKRRPIVFKMRDGEELKAEYFENHMTADFLDDYEQKIRSLDDETAGYASMHNLNAQHLAKALASIEIAERGKNGKPVKLPCDTIEDRVKILKRLSYNDLRLMLTQIAQDLQRPLDSDETTLSDGPAPKGELETESQTNTDS